MALSGGVPATLSPGRARVRLGPCLQVNRPWHPSALHSHTCCCGVVGRHQCPPRRAAIPHAETNTPSGGDPPRPRRHPQTRLARPPVRCAESGSFEVGAGVAKSGVRGRPRGGACGPSARSRPLPPAGQHPPRTMTGTTSKSPPEPQPARAWRADRRYPVPASIQSSSAPLRASKGLGRPLRPGYTSLRPTSSSYAGRGQVWPVVTAPPGARGSRRQRRRRQWRGCTRPATGERAGG